MISSDKQLNEFLPTVQETPWIALDTEADSLHAYPEKLCLIQISCPAGDFLIDPLTKLDLQPLWAELKKHELIFHGADYDLRLLRKNHGFIPTRIFDTMLGSRLMGEREFGLGSLVKRHLNIVLEKGSQKADWSKRPLTQRMEDYARADTRYLKEVSDILRGQLAEKGRLSWQEQSCDKLIADCAIPSAIEPDLVWRIKGSHKLARAALAILRELWHWREQEAVAANKPPYFVISHETLIDLAAATAENRPVDKIVPRFLSPRRRDSLSEAIQKGLAVTPQAHPEILRHQTRRQTEAQRLRFLKIEQKRNDRAAEIGLDPTLIASRATMLALADDWDQAKEDLMTWQRELLEK